MNLTGPTIIAGWGAANALLILVLRLYGGNGIDLGVYGGAAGIAECYAVAVTASARRRPGRSHQYVIARSSLPAVLGGLGLAVSGFAAAFSPWPWPVAGVLLASAALLAGRDVLATRRPQADLAHATKELPARSVEDIPADVLRAVVLSLSATATPQVDAETSATAPIPAPRPAPRPGRSLHYLVLVLGLIVGSAAGTVVGACLVSVLRLFRVRSSSRRAQS